MPLRAWLWVSLRRHRRHQKIIEEGPVLGTKQGKLRDMEQSAVRLARLVGYQGVGTVEYLYEKASGNYYFLELNPRLQVWQDALLCAVCRVLCGSVPCGAPPPPPRGLLSEGSVAN